VRIRESYGTVAENEILTAEHEMEFGAGRRRR